MNQRRMMGFLPELAKIEIDRIRNEIQRYKEGLIDEESYKKFRLENGIYGTKFQKDIQMIRVKVPGGLLDARQLETDKFEEARRYALNLLDQFADGPRQQEVLVN